MAQPLSGTTLTSKTSAIVGPSAYLTLAVPIVALIVVLLGGSRLLLNYIHVLTASTWTGTDLARALASSQTIFQMAMIFMTGYGIITLH